MKDREVIGALEGVVLKGSMSNGVKKLCEIGLLFQFFSCTLVMWTWNAALVSQIHKVNMSFPRGVYCIRMGWINQ